MSDNWTDKLTPGPASWKAVKQASDNWTHMYICNDKNLPFLREVLFL